MAKKSKGASSAEKAAAKAAKRAKQETKAAKSDAKRTSKTGQLKGVVANSAGGSSSSKRGGNTTKSEKGKGAIDNEEDLDVLLKNFRETWENEHKTTEERIGQAPSRRANATLTSCPLGVDIYLFGGEYFDGDRATFYPDLYRYTPASGTPVPAISAENDANGTPSIDRGTWRCYSSPTQPGPRSAHQVAASAANGGQLWLFGGEFAGMRMTSFHHYRDLWVFHVAAKQWERIDTKVKPSARSGHRMTFWKHFLILFGGFQDTGQRTSYLGDLWIFDTSEYKWHEVKQNELRKPSSRSGFSLLTCPEGVLLHGGYCKRYVKGQRTQGVALEDTWLLRLTLGEDGDLFHSGSIEWQRRRKIGYAPGPRSGCTMTLWSNRNMGVLFGGVVDTESDEESMESQCFNDLYAYQMTGNGRWISLNLRRPKKKAGGGGRRRKKPSMAGESARAHAIAQENGDDEETDKNNGQTSDNDDIVVEEEEPEEDLEDPQRSVPIPRFNTMLAIQRNTLFCYGGIHETSEREYTMDDFYTLDLSKMDRFTCHKACPIDSLEWNESESDSDPDSGSEDSDDTVEIADDEDDRTEKAVAKKMSSEDLQEGEEATEEVIDEGDYDPLQEEDLDDETLAMLKREREEREELQKRTQAFLGVSRQTNRSEHEVLSTPLPGEALREFYSRSKSYWSSVVHEHSQGQLRGKEMRRDGFELAEKRYLELKPVLEEIQRIQRDAGLDDDEMRLASAGHCKMGPQTGTESRNRR